MMERPSRRASASPARARMFRLADRLLGGTSSLRAMSPAAMPPAPALTSMRKVLSRPSWAKAERASIAVPAFIFPYYWKYANKQAVALHALLLGQREDIDHIAAAGLVEARE